MEDQYLRAHDIGDSRETNPNAYDLRKRYHKMYYHFKSERVYWILIILSRKFWIAFSALMFRGNGNFQMAVILLVLFTSFVLQVLNRPYMSTGERYKVLKDLEIKVDRAVDEPEFRIYTTIKRKLDFAIKMQVPVIELHTGPYADTHGKQQQLELEKITKMAEYAAQHNLVVNAGHGLNYTNVSAMTAVKQIDELNIGHAIVAEALFIGWDNAIKKMKSLIKV